MMLRAIILSVLIAGCLGFGLERPALKPRIVGGVKAEIESVPYQASLLYSSSHNCGAVIISNKWLLTAAHCVGTGSDDKLSVSVGSNYWNNGTSYSVAKAIPHPQFNYGTLDYDIALIQLNKTIAFNKRVQPVKLAIMEPRPGTMTTVSGWGRTSAGGASPKYLLKVDVPVVYRNVCKVLYQNIQVVTERMICTGYLGSGGKDACSGDSGGPLVANGTLYGLVSWGYSCALPEYPGVYTNVANLRAWIRSNSGV